MNARLLPVALLLPALLATARGGEAPAPAPARPPVPTVIEAGHSEATSTEKETTFTFSKGVKVTATNLVMTCRDLAVIALRGGDPSATLGKQEKFKSLIATGGVRIVQDDREASAERAEVFPGEDRVVLIGNPVIRNPKEGWEQSAPGQTLELRRGQRRAVLSGPENTRNLLTLPPLKDLGYEAEKPKPAPQEPASALPPVSVPLPSPK